MLRTLKTNIFYVLGFLLIGTLFFIPISMQYVAQEEKSEALEIESAARDAQDFADHVDVLMTQTWEHIENEVGVCYADCENYLKEYGNKLKAQIQKNVRKTAKKLPKLSSDTVTLVQELLVDLSIDPKSITITPFEGKGSPAAADDYTLYIDEADFLSFSSATQRFLIGHECAHMKNKDHSIESALDVLVDNHDGQEEHIFNVFEHATELRADIHAMLNGPEYVQGGINFFQTLIDRYGDYESPTHPRPSERLKIAQEMQALHTEQRTPQGLQTA